MGTISFLESMHESHGEDVLFLNAAFSLCFRTSLCVRQEETMEQEGSSIRRRENGRFYVGTNGINILSINKATSPASDKYFAMAMMLLQLYLPFVVNQELH